MIDKENPTRRNKGFGERSLSRSNMNNGSVPRIEIKRNAYKFGIHRGEGKRMGKITGRYRKVPRGSRLSTRGSLLHNAPFAPIEKGQRSKYTAGGGREGGQEQTAARRRRCLGKETGHPRDVFPSRIRDRGGRRGGGGGEQGFLHPPLPGSARSWRSLLYPRSLGPPGTDSVLLRGLGPAALDYAPLPRRRASSRTREWGRYVLDACSRDDTRGRDTSMSEIWTVTPHLFAFGRGCSGLAPSHGQSARCVVDSSKQLSNQRVDTRSLLPSPSSSPSRSPPSPPPARSRSFSFSPVPCRIGGSNLSSF